MGTKSVVEQYFTAMQEGRFEDMAQLKADDSVYWISGEGSWPYGGYQTDQKMADLWAIVHDRFPAGPKLTIRAILVDGPHATVYINNYAVRKDGRIYNNDVIVLVTVEDGLITAQREFLDTILINELFCGPMNPVL
jgi:ketosteroid isomerase-like protein